MASKGQEDIAEDGGGQGREKGGNGERAASVEASPGMGKVSSPDLFSLFFTLKVIEI